MLATSTHQLFLPSYSDALQRAWLRCSTYMATKPHLSPILFATSAPWSPFAFFLGVVFFSVCWLWLADCVHDYLRRGIYRMHSFGVAGSAPSRRGGYKALA